MLRPGPTSALRRTGVQPSLPKFMLDFLEVIQVVQLIEVAELKSDISDLYLV